MFHHDTSRHHDLHVGLHQLRAGKIDERSGRHETGNLDNLLRAKWPDSNNHAPSAKRQRHNYDNFHLGQFGKSAHGCWPGKQCRDDDH